MRSNLGRWCQPVGCDGACGKLKLGAVGGLKLGAVGTLKLGIDGGLKLGAVGGLKLGACGGLMLGIGGMLMLGTVGRLKLGAGGALMLGIGGGLKLGAVGTVKLGSGGGLKPLGTVEALGAALLAAGAVDSLDGAGIVSPVDSGPDDAGPTGWGFATSPVFGAADSFGAPATLFAFGTGVAALLIITGAGALLAAGGFVAIEGGFDPVLLLLLGPADGD